MAASVQRRRGVERIPQRAPPEPGYRPAAAPVPGPLQPTKEELHHLPAVGLPEPTGIEAQQGAEKARVASGPADPAATAVSIPSAAPFASAAPLATHPAPSGSRSRARAASTSRASRRLSATTASRPSPVSP